jgi:hypothetical protein
LVPNTSLPLQTTLAAEVHLADEQFLLEKQTLNKEKSLTDQALTYINNTILVTRQENRLRNQLT